LNLPDKPKVRLEVRHFPLEVLDHKKKLYENGRYKVPSKTGLIFKQPILVSDIRYIHQIYFVLTSLIDTMCPENVEVIGKILSSDFREKVIRRWRTNLHAVQTSLKSNSILKESRVARGLLKLAFIVFRSAKIELRSKDIVSNEAFYR
jgi:hypothetical protein